jgi:hypothetical protein
MPFWFALTLFMVSLSWMLFAILLYHAIRIMGREELTCLGLWVDSRFRLIAGVRTARFCSLMYLVLSSAGLLFSGYTVVMYLFNWTLDALTRAAL